MAQSMTDETVPSGEMPAEAATAVPETPQSVESATTNESESPQQTTENADTEHEKPKGGFQRRIDELTRNWREEQRRVDALTQALLAQRVQIAPDDKPAPAQPAKLPTLEEFGYDEAKYQAALLEYADKRAAETVEKRFAEYEKQRKEQTRIESFATRQKEFAKATPDFEDKVLRDPTLPITEGMRDVIIDSPSGPELAYYLANNREQAEAIAALPPHLAALEMGRIEGRLQAQKEAKAVAPAVPKPVPVVTKAPPPPPSVETVETDTTPKASDPDSDKLSDQEWMRARERELKRKTKR